MWIILISFILGRENLASTFFAYGNNSMNVIRHNDNRICLNIWEMNSDFIPPFLNNYPIFVEMHLFVENFAKYACASLCDNRDEIRAS